MPSLALLGLLLPVLGIGFRPALVALFLYALLPVVRGTVSVCARRPLPPRDRRRPGPDASAALRYVELPLALESIVGGVRTSAVIAVGTATLAAFIGAGGLGEPIFAGLKLARTEPDPRGRDPRGSAGGARGRSSRAGGARGAGTAAEPSSGDVTSALSVRGVCGRWGGRPDGGGHAESRPGSQVAKGLQGEKSP